MKMAEFEAVKLYILKAMPTARLEMLFFWRCQQYKSGGCPRRATSEGTSVVVRHQHNHPPALESLWKDNLVAKMRKLLQT